MSYQQPNFSHELIKEINVLRDEVQRQCKEIHRLEKENKKLRQGLQDALGEVGKILGRDGKRFNPQHPKKGNA